MAAAAVAVRHALIDATHRGFHIKDVLRPSPGKVCDSDILRKGGAEARQGGDEEAVLGSFCVEQVEDEEPDTPIFRARKFIKGHVFESICGSVICFNAYVIGYSSSYAMTEVQDNPENPSSSNDFIVICGYFFYFFYLCELILKLAVLQSEFWQTADRIWNYFDLLLVLVNTYDMVQAVTGDDGGDGGNTMWLRLLRLLKMCKMLRMVRVMRAFRELRLMLYSIIASLRMLFWSVLMLGMIMYIFGLVFLQAATDYLAQDETAPAVATEAYEEVVGYWGGVFRSMITLYEVISGGNDWAPPGKIIQDSGAIYYVIFLFYISFMTFAVLNVLTGVVVDAAMQVASKDSHDSMCHALGEELSHVRDAREVLQGLDENGAGEVDWATLNNNLHNDDVLAYFETLDIDFAEVEGFFRLLQNRNKRSKVRIDDFLTGCLQMKSWGSAKSVQLVYLMHDLAALQATQSEHVNMILSGMQSHEQELVGIRQNLSDVANGMVFSENPTETGAGPRAGGAGGRGVASDGPVGISMPRREHTSSSIPSRGAGSSAPPSIREVSFSSAWPDLALLDRCEDTRFLHSLCERASTRLQDIGGIGGGISSRMPSPESTEKFVGKVDHLHKLLGEIRGPLAGLLTDEIIPEVMQQVVPQLAEGLAPELSRQISGQVSAFLEAVVVPIRELVSRLEHETTRLAGGGHSPKAASAFPHESQGRSGIRSWGRSQAAKGKSSAPAFSAAVTTQGAAMPAVNGANSPTSSTTPTGASPRQCAGLHNWLTRHKLPEYYEAMLVLAQEQGANRVEDFAEIEDVNIPTELQMKPIQRNRLAKALRELQGASASSAVDPATPKFSSSPWTPIAGGGFLPITNSARSEDSGFAQRTTPRGSPAVMDARWQAAVQSFRDSSGTQGI